MPRYLFLLLFSTGLAAQNIPIDFEPTGEGADWTWTVFENAANPPLEIIENPDPTGFNTSATVAKFTALPEGAAFAGCESQIGSDIGNFVIDENNSIIRILVWKPVISDVGIKLVRADFFSLGEIKIPNTVVNQWEQLEFDFSAHIGNTYDQIVIFPDFAERDETHILYFDSVYGEPAFTSTTDPAATPIRVFPNPVGNLLYLENGQSREQLRVLDASGRVVVQHVATFGNTEGIDVSRLVPGLYFLELSDGERRSFSRFVKD